MRPKSNTDRAAEWGRISIPALMMIAGSLIAGGLLASCLPAQQADHPFPAGPEERDAPIVLRDLSLIRNRSVTGFDAEGIQLSDGTQIGWDRVLKARVPERQAEFDRLIREVGLPIFRLKKRVGSGDWTGGLEIAAPLFEQVIAGKLKMPEQQRYLVCLASYRGHLELGARERAVLPFLFAAQLQKTVTLPDFVGKARLTDAELEQSLAEQLVPVWFDVAAANQSLEQLNGLLESDKPGGLQPAAGVAVYRSTLAIAGGQEQLAARLIDEIESEWRPLVLSYYQLRFADTVDGLRTDSPTSPTERSDAAVVMAGYLSGSHALRQFSAVDELSDADRADLSRAMLELLTIPARYGERYPQLSAAALFQTAKAAEKLGQARDFRILMDELRFRYPDSYHAGSRKPKNE